LKKSLKFRLPKQIQTIALTSKAQEIMITIANKNVLTTIKITEATLTIEIRITIQEIITIKDQTIRPIETAKNQNKK
jgi:hypothetical protein